MKIKYFMSEEEGSEHSFRCKKYAKKLTVTSEEVGVLLKKRIAKRTRTKIYSTNSC